MAYFTVGLHSRYSPEKCRQLLTDFCISDPAYNRASTCIRQTWTLSLKIAMSSLRCFSRFVKMRNWSACSVFYRVKPSNIIYAKYEPDGRRPLGRPSRRWVDNIRMDLQEVGCGYMDWIGLAQDRDSWRTLVSAVMNLQVSWNAGNFLTSCKPVIFSRRTLHHGVSIAAKGIITSNSCLGRRSVRKPYGPNMDPWPNILWE